MKPELLLYTRKDCCLCEEMKTVIGQVALCFPMTLEEVDVDSAADLQKKYGNEVPVLFINGRKAFKYRLSHDKLVKKIR